MTLRITGGSLKNRAIKSPKTLVVRPTLSIIRQAVFNVLQSNVEGCVFLDLFAGSGIMGMEALSRGASFCFFIEKNRKTYAFLKENLIKLDLFEKTEIILGDCNKVLHCINRKVDIIYMDAPYDLYKKEPHMIEGIFQNLLNKEKLSSSVKVFIETGSPTRKILDPDCFRLLKERKYHGSILYQYQKN